MVCRYENKGGWALDGGHGVGGRVGEEVGKDMRCNVTASDRSTPGKERFSLFAS